MMNLRHSSDGSAYVELLIVILPLMLLMLSLLQLALLHVGRLAVQRAANAATRAAVVVLDDDPRYYAGSPRNQVSPGSPRLQDIRSAASIPLSSLAPKRPASGPTTVSTALGGRSSFDRLSYHDAALAVSFPSVPGAKNSRASFAVDDDVTVRVTYLQHCGVPLVRYFLCDRARSVTGGDLSHAVLPAGSQRAALGDARYKRLTAEATLPNHGAPYAY